MNSNEKRKLLPFTRLAGVDRLGINIITKKNFFKKQYLLILKEDFLDNNTKEFLLPRCCPTSVVQVLDKFKDILTNELPEELPPVWEVDHKIELVSGAKKQSSVSVEPKRVG